MSRVCPITGRGRHKANNVSHANNKSRKWQYPNLRNKRFFDEATGMWVRIRVSARGLKTLTKNGLPPEWRKQLELHAALHKHQEAKEISHG